MIVEINQSNKADEQGPAYRAERLSYTPERFASYLRLMGGELENCKHTLEEGGAGLLNHKNKDLIYSRFYTNVLALEKFAKVETEACSRLQNLRDCVGNFCRSDTTTPELLDRGLKSIDDKFSDIYNRYISCPEGVRILEYSTEVNGIHPATYAEITRIYNSLVIDPDLQWPQEGFLSAKTKEQVEDLMLCRDARLFSLSHDSKTIGFYILLPEVRHGHLMVKEACQKLVEEKIVNDGERVGWCETVGVCKEKREALKAEGINAYDALHSAVLETAREQGFSRVFAYVRFGSQANLAFEKHLRRGWQDTGIEIRKTDELTYRIMCLNIDGSYESERQYFANKSLFPERPIAHREVETCFDYKRNQDVSDIRAKYISPISAIEELKMLVPYADRVDDLTCTEGLVMQIKYGGYSFHFRQLRAYADIWSYNNMGRSMVGSLRDVAARLRSDIFTR